MKASLLLGAVAEFALAAVLAGLVLYGAIKQRLPLRDGGFVTRTGEPRRFRRWMMIFSFAALVTAFVGGGFLRRALAP